MVRNGRCGVSGEGIVRSKCGIVSWKYVKVGVDRLQTDMADVVCGQGLVRCKCGIVSWKYVTVGVGRL